MAATACPATATPRMPASCAPAAAVAAPLEVKAPASVPLPFTPLATYDSEALAEAAVSKDFNKRFAYFATDGKRARVWVLQLNHYDANFKIHFHRELSEADFHRFYLWAAGQGAQRL